MFHRNRYQHVIILWVLYAICFQSTATISTYKPTETVYPQVRMPGGGGVVRGLGRTGVYTILYFIQKSGLNISTLGLLTLGLLKNHYYG